MRMSSLVPLGLVFAGCLYVPYHSAAPGSRLEPDAESFDFLRSGPTREQVLLQLGEPDWVAKDQAIFVYTWKAEWGFFIVGGYGGGAADVVRGRQHFLLVEFDQDGIVRRWDTKVNVQVEEVESW
jgi:outer membrane protein assembly factor BamE (lipoprotein component of BamABCDE complex)